MYWSADAKLKQKRLLLYAGEHPLTGLRTQVMGKNKVLVKVHPEGKYVVDLDKSIDIAQVWLLTNLAYVHT